MELPPGYRGYGVDNAIAHPDTQKRQQQVEAILAELGDDADRYAKQAALMPYELPEEYQPRNQRFTDTVAKTNAESGEK
jgi:fumarate reductase flavoprotein subunit